MCVYIYIYIYIYIVQIGRVVERTCVYVVQIGVCNSQCLTIYSTFTGALKSESTRVRIIAMLAGDMAFARRGFGCTCQSLLKHVVARTSSPALLAIAGDHKHNKISPLLSGYRPLVESADHTRERRTRRFDDEYHDCVLHNGGHM